MTDPMTTIAVDGAPHLAVDVLPENAPGTILLDVSDVDGSDLLGWGLDGWANVVCDVTRVSLRRGATRLQGALTRAEAGTCAVTLSDSQRRFDPMASADSIHPGTPVRVRAWGYDGDGFPWEAVLFTGTIGDDLVVRYLQADPPTVSFTAVDVIGTLSLYDALGRPDPGVGDGDTLRGRVSRVLTEVGLSPAYLATDSDTAYATTLASTPLAGGWDDVVFAADAELGRVWVDAANQLVTRARGSELTGTVRGTLSDQHGEQVAGSPHCCYQDPVVRFGTDALVNRAIGARRVPAPGDGSAPAPSAVVQVDDTYSQARWTSSVPVTHRDMSLELQTDAQLQPWAEWLVLAGSTPDLRVDSVVPDPDGSPDAWQAVCVTDLGDRWHFRLHPAVGDPVAVALGVLGVEHEISPEGWTTTWTTTSAPAPGETNPSGWLTVDLSELDGEDVLAPFGGAVPL